MPESKVLKLSVIMGSEASVASQAFVMQMEAAFVFVSAELRCAAKSKLFRQVYTQLIELRKLHIQMYNHCRTVTHTHTHTDFDAVTAR